MSKNKESWFDKFIKFINLKDDKIIKEDLKPISKTAQKIVDPYNDKNKKDEDDKQQKFDF